MTARHHVALRAGHYEPRTDDTSTAVVERPPSGNRDVDVTCDICGGSLVWQVRSMNRTRWRRAGWAATIVAGIVLVALAAFVYARDDDNDLGILTIESAAVCLFTSAGASAGVRGIVKLRQEDGTRLVDRSSAHYAHPSRRHDGPAAS